MRDMTQGRISRHLISFAIPMILGNILQLTYNAVDSIIIGKFLGEDALAAVSTSNPIMTIMILGASGLGIGASVIMSRFYGAKEIDKLKKEFSTTILFGCVFSLLVFLCGFFFSDYILKWINTPRTILGMANTYIRIIFIGFLYTFQYNILSSALRSIGDAKTPVWFLGMSCVLNGILDVVFIVGCKAGVAGAGLATTVSEGISVICCIVYIYKKVPALRLKNEEWVIDQDLLKETLKTGSLTVLQQSAQPIGKVVIQSVINAQGIVAIGAFNAVCRIDDFACIPAQSIGSGIMTCTAQNRGAKNQQRVKESLRKGILVAVCYFPVICLTTLLLKKQMMQLLSPGSSVDMVLMGVGYLSVKAWFFILPCCTNAVQGYIRGLGKMQIVLLATLIQISIRAVVVILLVPKIGIVGEAYGCMIGWITMFIIEGIVLLRKEREWVK